MCSLSLFLDITNRINLGRVFVFDEMSMYNQELLFPVLDALREKFCILIGDSCQLPPVMGGLINWDVDSGELFHKYPCAYKCENGPNIRIVRFANKQGVAARGHGRGQKQEAGEDEEDEEDGKDGKDERDGKDGCEEGEAERNSRLRQLLLQLRQVIARQTRTKRETSQAASSKLENKWLHMWVEKINRSINVERELTLDKVLESLVEAQRQANSLVAWLRSELDFYEHLAAALDDMPAVLKSASASLRERFFSFQIPIVIGYENSFNFTVFDHIDGKGLINRSSASQNCWLASRARALPVSLRNVLMFASDADQKQVASIQNNVPANLMNSRNTFFPGMFIRCRENNSQQGNYNGQVGVFIGFFFADAELDAEARPVFETMRVAKLSATAAQHKLALDELTIMKVTQRLAPDMQSMARSLHMVFYDLETRQFASCRPVVRYLCEQCDLARRNEPTSSSHAPCAYHSPLMGRRQVMYMCFNWTSNYAQTVFCVQGATLTNEKMYLLGDTVLKNNILRTLYVVLSRCRSSLQIHVDQAFLLKALRAIFNQPATLVADRLRKLNLFPTE